MLAMASANGRTFTASIPGLPSGTVPFYAEGRDTPGVISFFPARGPLSRALYAVQDGRGAGPLQKVRLVMKPMDATFKHSPINTLSNEELGAMEGTHHRFPLQHNYSHPSGGRAPLLQDQDRALVG